MKYILLLTVLSYSAIGQVTELSFYQDKEDIIIEFYVEELPENYYYNFTVTAKGKNFEITPNEEYLSGDLRYVKNTEGKKKIIWNKAVHEFPRESQTVEITLKAKTFTNKVVQVFNRIGAIPKLNIYTGSIYWTSTTRNESFGPFLNNDGDLEVVNDGIYSPKNITFCFGIEFPLKVNFLSENSFLSLGFEYNANSFSTDYSLEEIEIIGIENNKFELGQPFITERYIADTQFKNILVMMKYNNFINENFLFSAFLSPFLIIENYESTTTIGIIESYKSSELYWSLCMGTGISYYLNPFYINVDISYYPFAVIDDRLKFTTIGLKLGYSF